MIIWRKIRNFSESNESHLPFPLTPNPNNCIYILHHDPFTRREKTRAMRARIPSPQGGGKKKLERNVEQEEDDQHSCTKRKDEESALDNNLIVVHGRCCRGGSFHTTSRTIRWRGEWKGRASSKLQLCRNYRAERIAGREECDC